MRGFSGLTLRAGRGAMVGASLKGGISVTPRYNSRVNRTPAPTSGEFQPPGPVVSPLSWDVSTARAAAFAHLSNLDARWKHVESVGTMAESWLRLRRIPEYVAVAAWVHDIGHGPLVRETGFSPLDGALFLDSVAAPPTVVSLVAYQAEAMTEADERGLAHELARFAPPLPSDVDVLTLLELSVDPHGQPITPQERVDDILLRYELASPVRRAVERSHSQLLASSARAAVRVGA